MTNKFSIRCKSMDNEYTISAELCPKCRKEVNKMIKFNRSY
jgi:hypothetical protein